MRRLGILTLVIGFALAPTAAQAAPDLHQWRLTRHGFGQLKVGLDVTKIERRSGRTLKLGYDTGGCAIWGIRGVRGLSLMLENGRLTRVDIYKGTWRTSTGIRLGDTAGDVRARYANVESQPHKYDPEGSYLIVPGPHRRVVFETDGDGVVTSIRGGRVPSVMYVEGCA